MEPGTRAIQRARTKLGNYSKALGMCSTEASEYAKCVVSKEDLKKDDCAKEFLRFNKCFKQALQTIK